MKVGLFLIDTLSYNWSRFLELTFGLMLVNKFF